MQKVKNQTKVKKSKHKQAISSDFENCYKM